jgi:hypothetical protein
MASPNNFNAGGPWVAIQLVLLGLMVISCPILTLVGVVSAIGSAKHKLGLAIATVIAAFPGVLAIAFNAFSR